MPTISPTLPNDGETIDAQDVNGPFNAILSVLNGNIDDQNIKPGSMPWSIMDSFSNQIPATAMEDSGNLEMFRADAKISFIPNGLIWSATTGLNAGMTSGEYYSNSGMLLPVTAITSRAFSASKDTYVSIAQNGSLGYSEVANNAAQPALPSNSNWLAKIVTNGSTVTSVVDMRQTALVALHNVDWKSLPEKKVTSKFTLTGGSTNSATYVPVPNNDTTVVIDKKFSTSKLIVSLGASFFITGTTGEARFGVKIGATDYPISKVFKNETGSGEYMSGEIEITDVTATGNVTVQFIVNVGSGVTTLNFGASNSMYLKVEEVPV